MYGVRDPKAFLQVAGKSHIVEKVLLRDGTTFDLSTSGRSFELATYLMQKNPTGYQASTR